MGLDWFPIKAYVVISKLNAQNVCTKQKIRYLQVIFPRILPQYVHTFYVSLHTLTPLFSKYSDVILACTGALSQCSIQSFALLLLHGLQKCREDIHDVHGIDLDPDVCVPCAYGAVGIEEDEDHLLLAHVTMLGLGGSRTALWLPFF